MCHKKNDSKEKFLDDTSISILDKCAYISLFVIPIFLIIGAFYGIINFIVNKTYNAELAQGVGILLSSIIAVFGVFAGFFFNKKQTYKEIVTKERTLWLNKLKDNVSQLIAILDVYDGPLNKSKYKMRAKDLFYNIITNLNVNYDRNSNNSDKEVELNKEAIIYLYLYAKKKALEVELNFEDEEKIKKCEEELNKVKFSKAERKFALEKFTIIYKTVWKDIKGEAD